MKALLTPSQLTLNDRSVTVQRESSVALGQGFRLGFLGTLHMDVFRQRLLDEYGSDVIVTRPFVPIRSAQILFIACPADRDPCSGRPERQRTTD